MNDYLSYFNINWNKYLHLFNIYENVQVIFLITKDEADNCLKIGNINNYDIYDVTYSKIKKLENIGPFIIRKIHSLDFNKEEDYSIEKSIVAFFEKNKYFKWIAVCEKDLSTLPNIFTYLIKEDPNCVFLIPYRNRKENLDCTVIGLNKYIKEKNIQADIFVIEQNEYGNWNKGCTVNIGFLLLKSHYDFFIFNDADTIPDSNVNFNFARNNEVIHIYGYDYCLGGIFSCHKNTFVKINGYGNNFFNWGREDRELEDRCKRNGVVINRVNQIKINQKGIQQLKHINDFNYWNLNKDENKFIVSRELYYLNQIEHFKEKEDGLNKLEMNNNFNILDNRDYHIFINLKKWTDGKIEILSDKLILKLEIKPELDTGIINVNNIKFPINPIEECPKILIKIYKINDSLVANLKYNYLFDKNIKLDVTKIEEIKIKYQNIDLINENICTSFEKEKIKFSSKEIYNKNYYSSIVSF